MKNCKGFGRDSTLFFTETHKECSLCKERKLHSEFHKDSNSYGLAYYCKLCANTKARAYHRRHHDTSPEYRSAKRDSSIKKAFGISLKEYTQKLYNQGSKCAICSIPLQDSGQLTHLDHNHVTGKLRDFLCTNCNRGLGHFKDNPTLLHAAMRYLIRHNSNVDGVKEVLGC